MKVRYIVSLGLGYVALQVGRYMAPFPVDNPFIVLMSYEGAGRGPQWVYLAGMSTYWVMWFGLPAVLVLFIAASRDSMAMSKPKVMGPLPWIEPAGDRDSVYVVFGERHNRIEPGPAETPELAIVPEKGLLCNTLVVGSIGSGKSSGVLGPAIDQLIENRAGIGGLILDPNGDLQTHARVTCERLGREYLEVGPEGMSYNPLAGSFDPHSLSLNIAELVANIHGESREPYWKQSYVAALAALIRIHLLTSDYVTFADLYETLLDKKRVGELVALCRRNLGRTRIVLMPKEVFEANRAYRQTLRTKYGFKWSDTYQMYRAEWSKELQYYLDGPATGAKVKVATELTEQQLETVSQPQPRFDRGSYDASVFENVGERDQKAEWLDRFEFWYHKDWLQRDDSNRLNVATSITSFLMGIWDNDPIRELLCPPKEAYESGWEGRPVLRSMSEVIEAGVVCGVRVPITWASGIGKTVNVLAKLEFQLAVQGRMVPDGQPLRPTMLVMDEFRSMSTVSEKSSVGDDVFMARNTRRGRCIVLAAVQTVDQIKPLVGLFRNQVFLSSDPATAEYASKRCGSQWKIMDSMSLSESNQKAELSVLDSRLVHREGGTGLSRSWTPHRVPLFDPEVFMGLSTNEAIACLFDGRRPMEPSRLYLCPSYVPAESRGLTYFEKVKGGIL